jgi:D-alanine-D-alanine ligase
MGVDDGALVRNYSSLVERINFIHSQLRDTALVEEYIEGREFYVTILGNDPAEALPLIELDFSKLPEPHPHIYGREAKFEEGSVQYHTTNAVVATDLTPEVRNRIIMTGLEAAHALQVSDYARVDIRLAPDARPYVVEVNANPYLERTGAVAVAALQAGMAYSTLINRIVDTAWRRWEASEPPKEEDDDEAPKRALRGRPAARGDHEGEEKEAKELLKIAG